MSKRKNPIKRKPGEIQAQRSVNLSPEHWAAFVDYTRTQGVVTADAIGDLIKAYLAKTEIAPSALPKSAQAQLAAAMRRQEQQFNFLVDQRVQQRLRETAIPARIKEAAELVRKIERRRGVMSKADYNAFRKAIHPDTGPHISEEERNRLSQLWEELKRVASRRKRTPDRKKLQPRRPVKKAPARPAMKRGRKPSGKAMTAAERLYKHRALKQPDKALNRARAKIVGLLLLRVRQQVLEPAANGKLLRCWGSGDLSDFQLRGMKLERTGLGFRGGVFFRSLKD